MRDSVDVHFVSEHVTSGALGPVVFNVYGGPPSATEMRRMAEAQRDVHRRLGVPLGVLSIATGPLALPEGESRRVAAKLRGEMDGLVAASSTVIPGAGFWVAGAISVINMIVMVSGAKNPSRVFRERREAIAWLLGVVPGPTEAAAAAALETLEMRARVEASD